MEETVTVIEGLRPGEVIELTAEEAAAGYVVRNPTTNNNESAAGSVRRPSGRTLCNEEPLPLPSWAPDTQPEHNEQQEQKPTLNDDDALPLPQWD